jgi:hypothetical protein
MRNVYKMFKDAAIDPGVQQKLNEPLSGDALSKEHEEFLEMLIGKLEKKELDPFNINTLYNRPVYDKLSENDQEKTDLTASNLMAIIRQIEQLWKLEHSKSFQIQNLVETVWQMKSKFEELHGDVYVI